MAFVQLKFGPVDKCSSFQVRYSSMCVSTFRYVFIYFLKVGDTEQRLKMIQDAFIEEINRLCSCGLTAAHLQNSVFSCADDGLIDQVVYRARILGSNSYNAQDLVSLIQAWVDSDDAWIIAGLFRFKVDARCATSLDTLRSPDCMIGQVTTTTEALTGQVTTTTEVLTGQVTTTTEALTGQVTISTTEALTSPTEIVTVVVGLLIIIVLVGIVVLLAVLLIRKRGKRTPSETRYVIIINWPMCIQFLNS